MKTIRETKKEASEQAKQDRAALKQRRKELSLLPREERAKMKKQDAAERKAVIAKRKAEIKAMTKPDAKLAKNYDHAYWRRYNRSRRAITTWSIVLVVLLIIGIPLGYMVGKFNHLAAQGSGYDQNAFNAEMTKAQKLGLQIGAEGLVLLKNEGNVLPLTTNKVNIFGVSAYSPVLGASGSAVSSGAGGNLYDGLKKVGVEYNPALFDIYKTWITGPDKGEKKSGSLMNILLTPDTKGEMPYTYLTDDVLSAARAYSDTAIYVISRMAGETNDIYIPELALTLDEQKTIDLMASTFDNVIVLVNTANQMELGWVNQYPNVKAVMWIGRQGQIGLVSVAQALVGQVNPSGRMSDTYVYDLNSNPASVNFGDFTYNNNKGQQPENPEVKVTEYAKNDGYGKFVQYEEGIYVGYRFYETYYLNDEAGYRKAVLYPFGYGLSYTTFDWELVSFDANASKVTAVVKVTNTGDVAGKDVVEVYYTAPYYLESGIEKSAVNLAAYGKTDMLEPGKSQELTITYDTNDMASYSMKLGHYILEHGDYAVKISKDAHTPVITETYNVASDVEITTDSNSGNKITNLFDFVNGDLTYMSRSDFTGTYPTAPIGADLNAPTSVIEALTAKQAITTEGTLPTTGANNGIKLIDLKGLDYNDPLWEKFLDQFTLKEMADLTSNAGYQTIPIDRLGMPHTIHCEGPMAIDNPFGGLFAFSWPMPGVLASSWNTQLAVDYGTINGEFAKIFGFSVWYAPATNIHRTQTEGRNGEYYSEDPVLSGNTAASQTIGAQAQGLVVTLKHFALNEQETNRNALHTWANEQSMREIYLKPWEIAIKDGGAHGVMSSYNDIGAIKTGSSKALLTDLIRNEWGFQGYVIADFVIPMVSFVDYPLADFVYAGNDLMIEPIFGAFIVNDIYKQYKIDPIGMGTALRENTKHVSYMLLQTWVFDK